MITLCDDIDDTILGGPLLGRGEEHQGEVLQRLQVPTLTFSHSYILTLLHSHITNSNSDSKSHLTLPPTSSQLPPTFSSSSQSTVFTTNITKVKFAISLKNKQEI